MTKFKTLLCSALFLGSTLCLLAQDVSDSGVATPKDMTEVGISAGYAFVSGDVKAKSGYGVGLHVRKALDYVFSIQVDALYAKPQGESTDNNRAFDMSWYSISGAAVISLNNFRFDRVNRKLNYYALAGAGANSYESNFQRAPSDPAPRIGVIERRFSSHAIVGAGVAVRLSPKMNLGLEHKSHIIFGRRADLLDGNAVNRGAFRDVLHFTALKLNLNLGNPSNKSEPLYWVNPLDRVMSDIDEVKRRADEAFSDADGDGVIDAIDQEPNTPSDVPVDTKGRTLDSDKDGVPDYRDKEPYYPPRAGEQINEDGVVMNPINTGGGVTEERVQELIDEALAGYGNNPNGGGGGVTEMFLPMVHFATDSYTIKYSDYGTLAGVAQVLKGNPNIRLVVEGNTDAVGTETYNQRLSYNRANAIVEHLVNNHSIARGRLVIMYKGQTDALVPKTSSYMNRRVEFRVANAGDVEMDPPAGKSGDGY